VAKRTVAPIFPSHRAAWGYALAGFAIGTALGFFPTWGHEQVVRNAEDSNAGELVLTGVTTVEEDASAHGGQYPDEHHRTFTQVWQAAHKPTDFSNPFSLHGEVPLVTRDLRPVEGAATTAEEALSGAGNVLGLSADPERAGQLIYVPIVRSPHGTWVAIRRFKDSQLVAAKSYAIGLYGRNGEPWFAVLGGR
jgi:hypothetical protein